MRDTGSALGALLSEMEAGHGCAAMNGGTERRRGRGRAQRKGEGEQVVHGVPYRGVILREGSNCEERRRGDWLAVTQARVRAGGGDGGKLGFKGEGVCGDIYTGAESGLGVRARKRSRRGVTG